MQALAGMGGGGDGEASASGPAMMQALAAMSGGDGDVASAAPAMMQALAGMASGQGGSGAPSVSGAPAATGGSAIAPPDMLVRVLMAVMLLTYALPLDAFRLPFLLPPLAMYWLIYALCFALSARTFLTGRSLVMGLFPIAKAAYAWLWLAAGDYCLVVAVAVILNTFVFPRSAPTAAAQPGEVGVDNLFDDDW